MEIEALQIMITMQENGQITIACSHELSEQDVVDALQTVILTISDPSEQVMH